MSRPSAQEIRLSTLLDHAGVKPVAPTGADPLIGGATLDSRRVGPGDLFFALRGYTTFHPTLSVITGEMEMTDEVRADPALFVLVSNGNDIKRRMMIGYAQAVAGGVREREVVALDVGARC